LRIVSQTKRRAKEKAKRQNQSSRFCFHEAIESGSTFFVNISFFTCARSGIKLLLMKCLLLFSIISAFPYALFASDSLPFPVSVGGQAAKDGTPFAKIEKPVAADAELSVQSKDGMIIVNVNAVNAKNEPVPGSTPAVILLQGKTKTNLDKTMDGKKLAAGNYVMSVVSEGKTASILLTIK